jgi:hypothetical protein
MPASHALPPLPPHPIWSYVLIECLLGVKRCVNFWMPNLVNMAYRITPPVWNPESASKYDGMYAVGRCHAADTRHNTINTAFSSNCWLKLIPKQIIVPFPRVSEKRVMRKLFRLRWVRLQRVETTTQRRALWYVPLTKRYSDDHVKNNEMDEACGTYGRQEWCIKGFGRGTWGKEITRKTEV